MATVYKTKFTRKEIEDKISSIGDNSDLQNQINNIQEELNKSFDDLVDFGLPSGTLWSGTKNIGTNNPFELGLFFRWGETKGYTLSEINENSVDLSWSTYKHGTDKNQIIKYTNDDDILEPEDDVATTEYLEMPTCEDFIELLTYTTVQLYGIKVITTENGDNSMEVFVNGILSGTGKNTTITWDFANSDINIESDTFYVAGIIFAANNNIMLSMLIDITADEESYPETVQYIPGFWASSKEIASNTNQNADYLKFTLTQLSIDSTERITPMPIKAICRKNPTLKFYNKPETIDLVKNKVDKVEGKGLSTNDYTDEDKALIPAKYNVTYNSETSRVVSFPTNFINKIKFSDIIHISEESTTETTSGLSNSDLVVLCKLSSIQNGRPVTIIKCMSAQNRDLYILNYTYKTCEKTGIVIWESNDIQIPLATPENKGLMSADDKSKLDKLSDSGGSSYTLPTASASVKGGIKVGEGLSIDNEVLSIDVTKVPNQYEIEVMWYENLAIVVEDIEDPTKLKVGDIITVHDTNAGLGDAYITILSYTNNQYLKGLLVNANGSVYNLTWNVLDSQFEIDPNLSDSSSLVQYGPVATTSSNGLMSKEDKTKLNSINPGVANGVAQLDSSGKVPSAQLPSYVDDVLEYADFSSFPATGESGKIYVAKNTNLTYRWGGTNYVEISASLALGETASTAYAGDKGKATTDKVDSHVANTNNPHQVTKAQVGLGNVDNTSDADKPISTATQQALNNKVDKVTGKGLSTNDFTNEYKEIIDNLNTSVNPGIGVNNKIVLSVNSTIFNYFTKSNPFNQDFSLPITASQFSSLANGDCDTITIVNSTVGDSKGDMIKLIVTHYDASIPASGNSAIYFTYRWHLSTNLTDPDSGMEEQSNGYEMLFGYILDGGLTHIYGTTAY